MHCNGNCVLMQKFKRAVKEDAPERSFPKISFED